MRGALSVLLLLALGCEVAERPFQQDAGSQQDGSVSPAELLICNEPPGPRRYMASPAALHELLVGRWMSCGGASLELGVPSMAGIEFGADGTYWVLVPAGGGGLERATGADASGRWETLMAYQTVLNLPSGVYASFFTFVEEEPLRISLGSGFDDLRWFAQDREDSVEDVAARCAAPSGPSHPVSAEETSTIPVGRWAWCEGTKPTQWPADAVAMELGADIRLTVLRRTTTGALVRGVGVLYEGVWSAISGLDAGSLSFCVEMPTGSNCYNTTFTDDPRGMSMSDSFGAGRWVALP